MQVCNCHDAHPENEIPCVQQNPSETSTLLNTKLHIHVLKQGLLGYCRNINHQLLWRKHGKMHKGT